MNINKGTINNLVPLILIKKRGINMKTFKYDCYLIFINSIFEDKEHVMTVIWNSYVIGNIFFTNDMFKILIPKEQAGTNKDVVVCGQQKKQNDAIKTFIKTFQKIAFELKNSLKLNVFYKVVDVKNDKNNFKHMR